MPAHSGEFDDPAEVNASTAVNRTPIKPDAKRASSTTSRPPPFPKRAAWLLERLYERAWNKHDLAKQRGPHHKTTQKVLDALAVREDVLEKIANALSKKFATVEMVDIPND